MRRGGRERGKVVLRRDDDSGLGGFWEVEEKETKVGYSGSEKERRKAKARSVAGGGGELGAGCA